MLHFTRKGILLLVLSLAVLLSFASCLSPVSPPTTTTSRRHAIATTSAMAGLLGVTTIIGAPPLSWAQEAVPANDLANNNFQDGPEGLKYQVLEKGTGPKPQRGQKIQTSYTLWVGGFPDYGNDNANNKVKQIDSSTKPILGDSPFKLRAGVKQVIRGWDLTLMDMQEGEKRRLVVPSELGYGDKGIGDIPGKAILYFEMKLTKVEKMEELSDKAKEWLAEHPL